MTIHTSDIKCLWYCQFLDQNLPSNLVNLKCYPYYFTLSHHIFCHAQGNKFCKGAVLKK